MSYSGQKKQRRRVSERREETKIDPKQDTAQQWDRSADVVTTTPLAEVGRS